MMFRKGDRIVWSDFKYDLRGMDWGIAYELVEKFISQKHVDKYRFLGNPGYEWVEEYLH